MFYSLLEISGNSKPNFPSNGKYPWKISYREFPFYSIFLLEFPELLVERFEFQKFNNFQVVCKLPKEILVPFAHISKVLEILIDRRIPFVKRGILRVES